MSDPELIPSDSLVGVDVGVSVSESADLGRLGLTDKHAQLAIGEIARAVLVAGGGLTYGGRIYPSGFTQFLMHEVRRYGQRRIALRICLAWQEHRKLRVSYLDEVERELGVAARLVCLGIDGQQTDFRASRGEDPVEDRGAEAKAEALTALRSFMASTTQARVLLGGKLVDFQGSMPGVVEEAITSVEASQPLYVSGGFGGAAAAIARTLELDTFEWAPDDYPYSDDVRVSDSLTRLRVAVEKTGWIAHDNGLSLEQNRQLAASHRPGEIASLVAYGLATRVGAGQRGDN